MFCARKVFSFLENCDSALLLVYYWPFSPSIPVKSYSALDNLRLEQEAGISKHAINTSAFHILRTNIPGIYFYNNKYY